MVKKIFTSICFFICANWVWAQSYNINLTIENMPDTKIVMAIYAGNDKFSVDSVTLNADGHGVFARKKQLEGGMYLMIAGKTALFNFIVEGKTDENFSIKTRRDDYKNIIFTDSPENDTMLKYIEFKTNHQSKFRDLTRQLESEKNAAKHAEIRNKLKNFNKPLIDYTNNLAANNKGTLTATIAKALCPLEEPDADIDENDPEYSIKTMMQHYSFNEQHFFDNVDFSDDRLLRTSFFEPEIFDYYFQKILIFKAPDSLIPCIDNVIEKTRVNKKMFRYALSHLLEYYQNSVVMGHEVIVIHLAEKYFLNDADVDWETKKFRKELSEFIRVNTPTLIGKTAPDLTLQTPDKRYESIHGLTAPYIVLFFYSPDCHFCSEETPAMIKIYHKYKYDLGVEFYAVNVMADKKQWREFIAKNELDWINVIDMKDETLDTYNTYTTPQILLLNSEKEIIGRRLTPESLDKFLEHLTKAKK